MQTNFLLDIAVADSLQQVRALSVARRLSALM
jgi:hypothetical protein